MTRRKKERLDKTGIGLAMVAIVVLGIGYFVADNAVPFQENLAEEITNTLISDEKSEEINQNKGPVFVSNITPAYQFITTFSAFKPAEYNEPQVQLNGTASTFATWICGNIDLEPAPTLGARSDLNKNLAVITHTYGAGQAPKVLQDYQSDARNCSDRDGDGSLYQRSPLNVDAPGFVMSIRERNGHVTYVNIWSRGDVIVAVSSPSLTDLRDVSPEYDEYLINSLTDTQCLATEVSRHDYVRSPYYSSADYKGWERGREVSVTGDTFAVYAGVLSPDDSLSGDGVRVGALDTNMLAPGERFDITTLNSFTTQPESPIPDGVPTSMPSVVSELQSAPTDLLNTSAPKEPQLTGTIPERVVDPDGPGCGWVWSGQLPPEWDDAEEKSRVDALVSEKENELSNNYSKWITDYNAWYMTYLENSIYIAVWNDYAQEANKVTEEWSRINSVRAEYREQLDKYWSEVNERNELIETQAQAQEEYDNLLLLCEAKESEVVEEPPTTVIPTPTPTVTTPSPSLTPEISTTPEPEVQCPPEYPEILNEEVSTEPTPPTRPAIPLPDAWDDIPD